VAPPKKAIVIREEAVVAEAAPVVESAPSAPTIAASLAETAKMFEAPAASVADVQEKVRAMLEKGLTETRATYSKAKSAADEASNAMETSFANAKSGIVEMNVKALAALRANADANFDFLKSIFHVKSAADLVTLQTEFTRKQIEMLTGHTKELGALAQKVANDTVEPLKAQAAKTFKTAV
jgi:phasin